VTGRQDPAAGDCLVVVDAFDVITSGRAARETDPAITYSAGWLQGNRTIRIARDRRVSTIRVIVPRSPLPGRSVSGDRPIAGRQAGIARVILDGTGRCGFSRICFILASEGPRKRSSPYRA